MSKLEQVGYQAGHWISRIRQIEQLGCANVNGGHTVYWMVGGEEAPSPRYGTVELALL